MEDNTLQLLEESGISENSIVALAQALSKIESYIPTNYVNDDSPDLDADNLNHAEQGIKRVTDALNLAIDTINSQSDTIAQLNSDLKWKYYSQVSQIGLSDTSTITFDQILTTITNYSILEFAAFKTDYPALNLPGSGQRHKVKVVCPLSGYVYLEDIDLSNNVIYTNRHDGNNYSGWMRLQSAVNEIVFDTIVLDPSGNDYVDIPVEGMNMFWSPLVMNGDGVSWPNGYVRAIETPLNQNVIRVFLSENRTGSIRLNYCYRKK